MHQNPCQNLMYIWSDFVILHGLSFIWWLEWPKVTCRAVSTYKLMPIPIASVATNTLQGSLGLLNFWAWANFVAVQQWIEKTNYNLFVYNATSCRTILKITLIKWTLRKRFEILRLDRVFVGISFLTFKIINN